jgi:AraC-like DNA-binding protein
MELRDAVWHEIPLGIESCRHSFLDATVSRMAAGIGFTHLARFAGYYKDQYGESPSQTLKSSVIPAG